MDLPVSRTIRTAPSRNLRYLVDRLVNFRYELARTIPSDCVG